MAELIRLFPEVVFNTAQMAERLAPWDLEIGRRLWVNYNTDVINKVGWLSCCYSGYGNAITSEPERINMLRHGTKVAVHQVKSAIEI